MTTHDHGDTQHPQDAGDVHRRQHDHRFLHDHGGEVLTWGKVLGVVGSALVGGVVWGVGLPGTGVLFGTPVVQLTMPAALLVTLGGISVVGAVSSRRRWTVVDAVVAAVLGVAGAFLFWAVAAAFSALKPVPLAGAALAGLWLIPGVLGGLVVRKPGAALYTELVASVLEALLGDQYGFSSVYYGVLQGLGAEFALALLFYRRFGPIPAVLSGAGAGVAVGLLDISVYYPDLAAGVKTGYVALAVASGAVIAGAGGWLLTRALAGTGALGPLASGRSAERV